MTYSKPAPDSSPHEPPLPGARIPPLRDPQRVESAAHERTNRASSPARAAAGKPALRPSGQRSIAGEQVRNEHGASHEEEQSQVHGPVGTSLEPVKAPYEAHPGHAAHGHPATEQRLAWALQTCAQAGIRVTPNRRRVLEVLAAEHTPINLDSIACDDALRGHCDTTTVYRTLMLMCEANVLRQVNLRSKARFFVLNIPGENHDHLVCRRCGTIECLPGLSALQALAAEVATRHGYVEVRHDLEFHGLCPACQRATRYGAASNKRPRMTEAK